MYRPPHASILLGLALGWSSTAMAADANDTPCDQTHVSIANTMVGEVLETMDAASYTYVRLDIGAQGTWAALPQTAVAIGDCLVLQQPQRMLDFASPTLGRTFPEIYFATVEEAPDTLVLAAAHAQADDARPEAPADQVARAEGEGSRTIAEVHAQRQALAGKEVRVRGRVTKVSSGIQGKTWLHLMDGTGEAGEHSDELIVTTTDDGVRSGEIIEARGVIALDLDLGFGYHYDVLIQDATLSR